MATDSQWSLFLTKTKKPGSLNMLLSSSINMNKDFRRIYRVGKSFVSPVIVTYVAKNRLGFCRMGITASKKVGKAVQRNRAKRLIKAAFRELQPSIINQSYDIIFVARTKTTKVKMQDVLTDMEKQLRAAGLITRV